MNKHGVLTKRQVEVLELVALGKSNAEVADVLFITKRSIDFHLASVNKRLGTHNRVEAINVARRRGLLSCPDYVPAATATE